MSENIMELGTKVEETVIENVKDKPKETDDYVKECVLEILGKPTNMTRFQICNVFDNNWRITIYTSPTSDSWEEHPIHSYFIKVDEDGKIISSNPELKREYA